MGDVDYIALARESVGNALYRTEDEARVEALARVQAFATLALAQAVQALVDRQPVEAVLGEVVFDLPGMVPCARCAGSGFVLSDVATEDSTTSAHSLACRRCGGTGRTPTDQLDEAAPLTEPIGARRCTSCGMSAADCAAKVRANRYGTNQEQVCCVDCSYGFTHPADDGEDD